MSPTTVADATETEMIRRIADMSHLSRGEPSPPSTLTSAVAHVTIEVDVANEPTEFPIGISP
jgi:hypothetical protein